MNPARIDTVLAALVVLAAFVLPPPSGGHAMGDASPPPCYGNHPEAAFWGGMLWDDADW